VRIVIVGCGRVGAELAHSLHDKGRDVVVVDQSSSAFDKLPADYGGRRIQGDALTRETLIRAGIEGADGVAAVTNSDTVNATIAQIARQRFHVPRVVVRNYETRWVPMHEAFGVPVVSSTLWGAQRIEEILEPRTLRAVSAPPAGEAGLYELVIPDDWAPRALRDIGPPIGWTAALLNRSGRGSIPSPDSEVRPGDVILLSATPDAADEVRRRVENGG